MPYYSTLCRRQKRIRVVIPYQPQPAGLHLLIDSTGVKMLCEGEWKRNKHGADYRRKWRNVHLGIDAETLGIRLSQSRIAGLAMRPCCRSCSIRYRNRNQGCRLMLTVRKNGKPRKGASAGALARNEILAVSEYLGRPLWKRWSGYHRRSLVETKMRCYKFLGELVVARDFDRQVAELQIRVVILNRFTQLGMSHTLRVA